MPTGIDDHKFNDDLLLAKEERQLAARKYPAILHVLDHPELRDFFLILDTEAKRQKRQGLILGFCAIGLVLLALLIASAEQLSGHSGERTPFWDRLPAGLALLSAGCGIVGAIVGGIGILSGRRKRQWLYRRLMAERTRQFHFQTLIFRADEILQSLKGDQAKSAFLARRNIWFETFKQNFVGKLDSEFTKMIGDEDDDGNMLLHEIRKPPSIRETKQLEPLFAAYRELRIQHQLGYASYKLTEDRRIFSDGPRNQALVLSNFGFLSIVGLCAVHLIVLFFVLFAPAAWETSRAIFATIAVWFALVALAIRAIEQGLQPEREIERYQQYRSGIKAIRDRFDGAGTPAEKLRVMVEMEQLTYDEMRNFLITNDRSRFVM